MKFSAFVLLLILIALRGISQEKLTENEITKKAISNLAVCVINFSKKNKFKSRTYGCGIIISGKYFATCYHLLIDKGAQISSVYIKYNFILSQNQLLSHDSVFVDLNYKYLPNQYDYRNHVYDSSKRETDFVVLKLKESIPYSNLEFSNTLSFIKDTLYTLGIGWSSSIDLIFTRLQFPYNYKNNMESDYDFLTFLGFVKEGFSGAPVYNRSGQIVGIVQSGWNTIEEFNEEFHYSGQYPIYPYIIEGYKKGERLGEALKSDYFIKNYLCGYFK